MPVWGWDLDGKTKQDAACQCARGHFATRIPGYDWEKRVLTPLLWADLAPLQPPRETPTPQGWGGLASGIPRNPAARVNFRTASPPGGSHPAPREVGGDQRAPSLPPPPRPAPPRPKGPASPPPSPSPSQSPAGSSGPALPSGQRAAPELEGLRAGTPGLGGGRGWSGPGAGFEDGLSPAFAVAQAAALLRPPSSFPPPPEGIR